MRYPRTKQARQARIANLLTSASVESQAQLGELLVAEGFDVTQATLSRDLDDMGAAKVVAEDGHTRYMLPQQDTAEALPRLSRAIQELLVGVDHSANIVVLHTPPGGAMLLASALDNARMSSVIGTVAGDDTVLLVTRDPDGGNDVATDLLRMAGLQSQS
jgi:transcriptional regulator of arginine metabolism